MEKVIEKSAPVRSKVPKRRRPGNGDGDGGGNGNGNGQGSGHDSNGATPADGGLNHRQLLAGLRALQRGEFGARLPDDLSGVDGQICSTFNELAQFAEALRVGVVDLR